MVDALLCDIDGTLVQSNWLHAAAWKDAFAEIDLNLDLEEVRRQIGKGGDELIPVFVPWWRRAAVEEPLKALRKFIFQTTYLPQVKPMPRVRELLVTLQKRGIRLALATSADPDELQVYKRMARMEDLIAESTTAADADRTKPHPDIFSATLTRLGIPASRALALGDTPYDAEAAGKAGVWTIGVESGGWSHEDLLQAGCIEVYRDVAELLDNIDRSALVRG